VYQKPANLWNTMFLEFAWFRTNWSQACVNTIVDPFAVELIISFLLYK
jgi:hypothetical protein